MFTLHRVLSLLYHPEIDPVDSPVHRFLKSVFNITIEQGWLRLRMQWCDNIYLQFMKGAGDGIYNESDWLQ